MEQKKLGLWKEACEHPLLSPVLSGNFLGAIQSILLESGFSSFPTIALCGAPGTGKSTIARLCCESKEYFFFSDSRKALLEGLEKKRGFYTLVDDLADISVRAKERTMSNFDEFVRRAYAGESSLLCITVESKILPKLSESCKERLLILSTDHIWKQEEFQTLISNLQVRTDIILEVIRGFREWISRSEVEELKCYVIKEKEQFVKQYKVVEDTRTAYTVFCYHISMQLLARYLLEEFKMQINLCKITKITESLIEQRRKRMHSSTSKLSTIFERLIFGQKLKIQYPKTKKLCSHYLLGTCNEADYSCDFEVDCNGFTESRSYDPLELVIEDDFDAIFLEEATYIPHFPQYLLTEDDALLIFPAERLLYALNNELEIYCKENQFSEEFFTPRTVGLDLFKLNMCLFMSEKGGRRYRISNYVGGAEREDEKSVFLLRLTKAQREYIKSNTPDYHYRGKFYEDVSKLTSKMIASLKSWDKLRARTGPVGKELPTHW